MTLSGMFRRLFVGTVCMFMMTALCLSAAAFAVTDDTVLYHTDTALADGLLYETFLAEKNGVSQRAYLFTYTPGTSVVPIVTYGTHLWGMERTSTMASLVRTQSSADGVRVVGGINGDFYSMQTGIPIGIMIDDGQILTSDAGAAALGICADGTYLLGVPSVRTVLRVHEGTDAAADLPVAHINKYPAVWGAYLCTPAHGTTTHSAEAGTEYVFRVEEGTFSVGTAVSAVVTEIRRDSRNSAIPADGFVIYLHPDCTAAAAYQVLAVGDTVTLEITANDGWESVTTAIGGGDILIRDGSVYTDGFSVSHAKTVNPRTAVGYTADGRLLFYAVDGRSAVSEGMTLAALAQTMVSFGCVGALNLDGGGSTTVLVRAEDGTFSVMNAPSDGTERKISNAVLFTDASVSDGIPHHAEITPESPLVFGTASVMLDAVIYDKSHAPVSADHAQITWSASGGVIDERGYLTPDADAASVTVMAQICIPVTGTEDEDVTEYRLTAEETVYRTDALDGITADVSALTVPLGGSSRPITVYGVWRGQYVHIAAAEVSAMFDGGTDCGYADASLRVHSTADPNAPTDMLAGTAFPTRTLVLSVTDRDGTTHTTRVPVTFGAVPETVMTMEDTALTDVFRTDGAGVLARAAGYGRQGTAAVSFTASSLALCTTPAASNPVKRIDLYMKADALPKELSAVLLCGGTRYTLPWVMSDDFTRVGGWMRLSLDTTVIADGGIRDFVIETLLHAAAPFAAVIDDLTYCYGDVLPTFTDTLGTWAHDSIEAVFRMGAVSGIANGDGTYRYEPTGQLTRAEFAVMLARFMALSTEDTVSVQSFADADAIPAWASPYIAAVTEAGYMLGKGVDGGVCFAAGDTMTRAEVMQVLGAILRTDAEDKEQNGQTAFADDAQIPDWARENIAAAVRAGIVAGFDDNTIRPAATVTRAEIAALLWRLHGMHA